MSDQTLLNRQIRAINKNEQVRKLQTFGDKLADKVTAIAGSTGFLTLNVVWFVVWTLLNTGVFGEHLIIDKYPFSFLTTAVSLEAIILSTFVLMSQRRQAKLADLRTDLDYRTDVKAEADIKIIVSMLERLAGQQGVDVTDLLAEMKDDERRAVRTRQ
ncbi:MAG: hypothetical protein JWP13_701 [Candidatus Saccharibacteria bacterium]|nr:hypothetical protein [Candidatus Saccharibacteria bacterium]